MNRLMQYQKLVHTNPELFINDESVRSIKVITNLSVMEEKQVFFYEEAKRKGKPDWWYNLGVLAEDDWVVVLRDLVTFPNGNYGCYIRMVNKASTVNKLGHDVVILPLLDNQVVLLRRFRHEKRQWEWEVPRGFGEPHLSAEENAYKEVQEETGLIAEKLVPIGGILKNGGYSNLVFFLALVKGEIIAEENEGIQECKTISINRFKQMISAGDITDSYTIEAFAYASIQGLV